MPHRICRTCGIRKDILSFRRVKTKHLMDCKECYDETYYRDMEEKANKRREWKRKWREDNKDKVNQQKREYHLRSMANRIQKIVSAYGGKCSVCGEKRPEALILHHSNGGGKDHREKVGRGAAFYAWIIKNNFPDGLCLICGTCHTILHRKEIAKYLIDDRKGRV